MGYNGKQRNAKCSMHGCDKPVNGRSMCVMHYTRLRRHGDVNYESKASGSNLKRLEFYGWTEVESGCWEWKGKLDTGGYGVINVESQRGAKAHRVAYAVWVGPIGDMHVLHKCDNRRCINPDHLWLGTHSDNMQDMWDKGRHPLPKKR